MKLKSVLAGVALAGVLAVSAGGAVMAADGEGGSGDCLQERLRTQDRTCSQTCTQDRICSRNCDGQSADDTPDAAAADGAGQAGNSYGESGEGTGPGLERQWGKSAR